jgi:mannosyl-oligosaccharide alpha-1,2-mannosidase
MPVFDTPSGIPMSTVNTVTGETARGWSGNPLLAEILTCQLEYKYLSYLTGRHEYYEVAEKVMDIMYNTNLTSTQELLPTFWSAENRLPIGRMPLFSGLASLVPDAVSRSGDRRLKCRQRV